MKKFFVQLTLIIVLSLSYANAQTHYYVKTVPSTPIYPHTTPPSSKYIWITEEWAWRDGKYVYVPGYWVMLPPNRHGWVPGHWLLEKGKGYYWISGHWK